uniref:NADH-ubiquinone oxidoreductase chain 4 n=1 Tax=Lucernaria janetae TaxID=313506 RepID=G9ISU5_LUCJA|nr:NADH dehydrogenase subunit 4 [Lucernaria janetae]
MWLILNFLIFSLACSHLWSLPRFGNYRLKRVGLQWSLAWLMLNTLWGLNTGFPDSWLMTGLWTSHPLAFWGLLQGPSLFAMDGIAAPLIILSTALIPLSLLASWDSIRFLVKEFILCLLIIDLLLVLTFSVWDLMWFYVLFEGILIPMFLIIGVWGSRVDKVTAAFYFFFFTLIGSLLFLLSLFFLYQTVGSTQWSTLSATPLDPTLQYALFGGFMVSFAVKIPQFPCHIWLPQAHVEAPVAGSILLAGILLKLGGYGYLRFCLPLFPAATQHFGPGMCLLGVLAVLWGSINTLRQADMKRLVAYSSVAHMGLVTVALFSGSPEGLAAGLLMMVAHGLVSPALFAMVTCLYDRFHTRLIRYYRGLTLGAPLFSVFFVSFSLMNMSLPPSGNFIAEWTSLVALFQASPLTALIAGTGVILSAGYSLWFCNRICFGTLSPHLYTLRDLNRREVYLLFPLLLLPFILGLYPASLIDPLGFQGWLPSPAL